MYSGYVDSKSLPLARPIAEVKLCPLRLRIYYDFATSITSGRRGSSAKCVAS